MRIKFKLALPSVIGLLLVVVLIHDHWEPMQLQKARQTFEKHTQELLVSSESGIIQQLLERDLGSLYANMEYIEETYTDRWFNIKLYNEDNKLIYPIFRTALDVSDKEESLIHVTYPLKIENTNLGRLELDVNWGHEQTIIIDNLASIRNMIIWMVILILFITTLSQYQIIYKPLKKLIEATNKIKQGKFNARLPKVTPDEIGDLTNSFKEMSEELAFQKLAVDKHSIVSATDKYGLITDVNLKFLEITGYSRSELIGKPHSIIRSDMHPASFFENMWATISSGHTWHGELCNLNKQGERYWVSSSIIPFLNMRGVPERYISIRTEITKQKKAEERLKYLANHDTLTGLPKRRLLKERLSNALSHAKSRQHKVAVLFIDLDGFKAVNDTFGHKTGDLLLVEVAAKLRSCKRDQDTVARLSGDEFIVLLNEIKHRDEVSIIAQKIIDQLSSPIRLSDESTVKIGASIGIALYPDHHTEAESLIKKADDMMYSVKRGGKNNFSFYDEVLTQGNSA